MSTPTSGPIIKPAADDPGNGGVSTGKTMLSDMINWVGTFNLFANEFMKKTISSIDAWALYSVNISPFNYIRSLYTIFADFGWLIDLVAWFLAAFGVIFIVSMLRFLFSLWGIIDRVVQVIQALPFF